ncbi:MAG: NAD-dependent succinate-semialdehyde dehydrogenase [Myxococcota bacterium]
MSRPGAFTVIDPTTDLPLAKYDGLTDEEAAAAISEVRHAFPAWRRTDLEKRAKLMRRAAKFLTERTDQLARLMTREMGKPFSDGRAEVLKCAFVCTYFADNAAAMLADEPVDLGDPKVRAFVSFQPVGVILALMPWNFPFWQLFRCAAPAMMAGNCVVMKHADNVPGCALAIESIFKDAGFPENVFKTLLVDVPQVSALITNPDIAAVSLTGSVNAGKAVAAAAATVLKKCVLELGGSDAYVVLADADPVHAAKVCATARMVNGGQSCIAGKRFVVSEPIRERFTKAMVEAMGEWVAGDPSEPDTKLGPLVNMRARDGVHKQVTESIEKGAKLLLGGEIPRKRGAWYPATVLADVRPGQPAYDEEIFGPVAAIITARDDDDAVRIANDSRFGLGAAVLTRDLARGEAIAARELEAGLAFVNHNVKSDPRLPFSGVKESGYGREVSRYGLLEFVTTKTVSIAL